MSGQSMRWAVAAAWLSLGGCAWPPDGVVVDADGAAVSAALLDYDRYRLINAYDFFALPADTHGCAGLVAGNLATGFERTTTSERVRVCPQDGATSLERVLGKVSPGKRSILVVAAHVPGGCSAAARQEVDNPGQPLAVGCEEQDVTAGASHRVYVKLLPHRDP